jgi:hypothetical protein
MQVTEHRHIPAHQLGRGLALFQETSDGSGIGVLSALEQERHMDFGLFYYCQGRGVPHDQAYAEMLDQITLVFH